MNFSSNVLLVLRIIAFNSSSAEYILQNEVGLDLYPGERREVTVYIGGRR